MKRLFSTTLAVMLLLLVGCAAKPESKPDAPAEPERTAYYLTDEDIPLDERALSRAVPDFLTEEQQTLYRQAFALYDAMFGGETTGIDCIFPAALSVFTEELFDELNACPTEKYPDQRVFIDYNGRLCYQGDTHPTAEELFDRSDVFTLISSDDERVEFTVHYDADHSFTDLLPAYTDADTIVMVRTDAGWRVSAFEYPN